MDSSTTISQTNDITTQVTRKNSWKFKGYRANKTIVEVSRKDPSWSVFVEREDSPYHQQGGREIFVFNSRNDFADFKELINSIEV